MCTDAHRCTRFRAFHEIRMRQYVQWIIDTQGDTYLAGQDITCAEVARRFREYFSRPSAEYEELFHFYIAHAGEN